MIDLSPYDSPRGMRPFRAEPRKDERVLHIHLWAPGEPQLSLCQALAVLGADFRSGGCYERVDWPRIDNHDRRDATIMACVRQIKPTLIWMQLQTPGIVRPHLIQQIREVVPEAVIVSWCGDVGRDPAWSHQLGPHVDALLFSSVTQAKEHRAAGFPNAAYLQIGYDEDYHIAEPLVRNHLVRVPEMHPEYAFVRESRVAFFGQNYTDSHWRGLPGHEAQLRRDVVGALLDAQIPLALHGSGWSRPPARPALLPRDAALVYRQSRLALSISLTSKLERYTSDRLFRALACGCCTLVKRFDDMEALGLQDSVNCLVFDTPAEAAMLAQAYLNDNAPPAHFAHEIREAGALLARTEHTWPVRMAEQQVYLDAIRVERKG
jgi:hypothetical protein